MAKLAANETGRNIGVISPLHFLDSIKLMNCTIAWYNIMKNQNSVSKVIIKSDKESEIGGSAILVSVLNTLQNLRHLKLHGLGTIAFFNERNFSFALTYFYAEAINNRWDIKETRLDFFRSQGNSLKFLIIKNLPFNFEGKDIIRFIFRNMQLQRFICGGIQFIENGLFRNVPKITADIVEISSVLSLLLIVPGMLNIFF